MPRTLCTSCYFAERDPDNKRHVWCSAHGASIPPDEQPAEYPAHCREYDDLDD